MGYTPQDHLGADMGEAIVLSKYLEHRNMCEQGLFAGKRVLETGAGIGLCGIVLGVLGASCTITDQKIVMDVLRTNVDKYTDLVASHNGAIIAAELDWYVY